MPLALITTLFFFSFALAFSQETSGTQSVTDTTTGEQAVDWDIVGPTARTISPTARDVRNFNPKPTSDYSSLFANQFNPVLNPRLPYGARIQNPGDKNDQHDVPNFYPFFRRPDSNPFNYSDENSELLSSNAYKPFQVPRFMPYQPGPFFSHPEMFRYSLDPTSARPANDLEKQNISASSPTPFILGNPSARLNVPYPGYPFPMYNYIPPEFFLPQGNGRVLGAPFSGSPIFSAPPRNPEDSTAFPQVDMFVNPPYVDREPGSEPAETAIPSKEAPPIAEPITPFEQPDSAPVRSDVLPRQPLPLNPFPFLGVLPPEGLPPPFGLPPRIPPQYPAPVVPEDNLLASRLPVESFKVPEVPPVAEPGNPLVPPPLAPQEGGVLSTDASVPPQEGALSRRIPYEFGYDMNDGKGTDQHRQEISDGSGAVTGSYGYSDNKGVYRIVNYIADKDGFRAFIKSNEPGVANPGSANVFVVAEVPPVQAIAEGLKQPRLEAVPVAGIPADLIPQASEPRGTSDQSQTVDQSETEKVENDKSETST